MIPPPVWFCCLLLLLLCSTPLIYGQVVEGRGVEEVALTPGDKERIVAAHNQVRGKQGASNMLTLEWHDGLAAEASKLTESCEWVRTQPEQLNGLVQGLGQLGEIVHVEPKSVVSVVDAVETWSEETYSYDYSTGQCNKVCWHYTQLVTAEVHSVGCSLRFCPRLEMVVWGKNGGYIISCLYGPGGDASRGRPFSRDGAVCSNCSREFPFCVEGLCSKTEAPSTTPSSTTTTQTTSTVTATTTLKPTTVETASASRLYINFTVAMCLIIARFI